MTGRRAGAAAVVAVALALLVGGCGSDEEPAGGGEKKTGRSQPENPADGAELSGVWSARPMGQDYTLIIVGDSALMQWDKGSNGLCDGQVTTAGSVTEVALQCAGDTDEGRDKGAIEYADPKSMRVNWNGEFGSTSFTRVADAPAELPENPDDVPGLREALEKLPRGTSAPDELS
ncbi:hypothetical protein MMF93_31950 [Streptomyces tubbatahanensis]|uniref:Lipoprotein n=1 Tax=Streptomyces tubbatahanensis TaxID=2923272 RepID=A0ABY3Y166_9ACTN|nr:hypothetical protein [Streptomyces tubbatahanensis]UNT00577.1 hypothetical protein MMF93_31950 [Streptomyces tubbatahanensis]